MLVWIVRTRLGVTEIILHRTLQVTTLLLVLLPARAATYYVAVNGDNASGDGSAGTPWRTIQRGINALSSGDTLNIAPGTYDEPLHINSGASGSSWDAATRLNGNGAVLAWVTGCTQRPIVDIEASYLVIDQLNIDCSNYPTNLYTKTPYAGNGGPSAVQVSQSWAHHIRFQNLKILGPPHGMGILLHDSATVGGNEIISCVISNQGWGFISKQAGDTFYHAVYIESPNNIVDGCTLGPPGAGARNADMDNESKPSAVQIFESNHGGALTNNIIRNCTINGPCRVGFTVCGDPGSGAPGGYNRFYNNVIHDTIYGAFIEYHCGTNSFYNNTWVNSKYGIWNAGADFGAPYSGGTRIANNIFLNVTNNLAAFANNSTCYLTNNLVYNCGPVLYSDRVELGRISSDPALANTVNLDFRLRETSPARSAGVDLSSVFTSDKSGTPRPPGAWDVGAHQFALPPATNPPPRATLGVSVATDLTTPENTSLRSIPIRLSASGIPPADLLLSAHSSDQSLVRDSAISFTGQDSQRFMTLKPVLNAFGSAVITLTVTDGRDTASADLSLTVDWVNQAPALSELPDQILDTSASQLVVPFTHVDPDALPEATTLSATSSNQELLPDANLTLSASGRQPSLTLTPIPGAVGTTLISLTATDGLDSTTQHFLLCVSPTAVPGTPNLVLGPGVQSLPAFSMEVLSYGVLLKWPSTAGKAYRIFCKSSLAKNSWIPISDTLTADGPQTTWLDQPDGTLPWRFYAVFSD